MLAPDVLKMRGRFERVAALGALASPMGVKATVRDGRLVMDEPTDLPEGTVLELVIDDGGDRLASTDHDAIRAAMTKSLQQAAEGRVAPAEDILAAIRARSAR